MKLFILYHPENEFARQMTDFADSCRDGSQNEVDLISLETPEGASAARLYDITDYPAILVVRDDGQLVKGWQGSGLPAISEVLGNLNI